MAVIFAVKSPKKFFSLFFISKAFKFEKKIEKKVKNINFSIFSNCEYDIYYATIVVFCPRTKFLTKKNLIINLQIFTGLI